LLDAAQVKHFGIPVVLVINDMHHHVTAIFSTPEDLSRTRNQNSANSHRMGQVQTGRSTYQLEILNDQIIGLAVVNGVEVHIKGHLYKITNPEPAGANISTFNMIATGDQI
jgi:hypothetical protein